MLRFLKATTNSPRNIDACIIYLSSVVQFQASTFDAGRVLTAMNTPYFALTHMCAGYIQINRDDRYAP